MRISDWSSDVCSADLPNYGVGEAFLVQKGNPKSLHSYEDIAKKDDAKLGVVVGAIEGEYASKMDIPVDRAVVFPDVVSALSGIQELGRASVRERVCQYV